MAGTAAVHRDGRLVSSAEESAPKVGSPGLTVQARRRAAAAQTQRDTQREGLGAPAQAYAGLGGLPPTPSRSLLGNLTSGGVSAHGSGNNSNSSSRRESGGSGSGGQGSAEQDWDLPIPTGKNASTFHPYTHHSPTCIASDPSFHPYTHHSPTWFTHTEVDVPATAQLDHLQDWTLCKPGHRQV